MLPEYTGDPRVVGNLLDGINRTKDDVHMWLAPFTPSHPHIITISFSTHTTVAMIRIWNYNKSRIHSYRGVRDMEMWLDHQLIFRGEISRGSGGIMNQTTNCGETILFTTDKDILYRVGLHDNCYLESQPFCYGDGNPDDERKEEEDDRGRDREKNTI